MDSDDEDDFKKLIGPIKPLKTKPKVKPPSSPKFSPTKGKYLSAHHNAYHPTKVERPAEVGAETPLLYMRNRLNHDQLKALQQGQIPYEGRLDLHGMPWDAAEQALERFMDFHLHQKSRLVLIIHGKSRQMPVPILKNEVNFWLRCQSYVKAFCSATPKHGANGALYVLL